MKYGGATGHIHTTKVRLILGEIFRDRATLLVVVIPFFNFYAVMQLS